MEFPILAMECRGKKFKQWKISVKQKNKISVSLITEYGIVGTKLKKSVKDIKRIPNTQTEYTNLLKYAEAQAKKLFDQKKKKGYTEQTLSREKEEDKDKKEMTIERNEQEEIPKRTSLRIKDKDKKSVVNQSEDSNKINKPPTRIHYPMLADIYNKKKGYIKFPCSVQPKLDGVRCVAIIDKLYSRNGNIFPELDHIKSEIKNSNTSLILDGELYTDEINFEKIVGLVRKSKKTEEEKKLTNKIYLNVFDCIDSKLSFKQRYKKLYDLFTANSFNYLKLVKTENCSNECEVESFLDKYIKEGYEGLILRNDNGLYHENERSHELQKLKKFIDEEFEIIGYETPDQGKEVGCVIWVCKTKEGKKFTVRPEGTYSERKKLYREGKKFIGKLLTVRYQEMTNDKLPRFPVGVGIRDYE